MLESIQRNVAWRAIPIAGIAAGTAHLLTNVLLSPLILDVEPALTLRYFASLVLGEGVLMDASSGDLAVGLIVHYALSILFTLVIAIVVHRWGLLVGIVGGAILGASIYLINLYTMTVFFDWFFAINSSVLFLSHVIFGAVAGGVYEMLDRYDLPIDKERTHAPA
jgi:hypothetical protein